MANIEWLGHASFRIANGLILYIDPWKLPDSATPANVILVSHPHPDHLAAGDIARIRGPHTVVIGSKDLPSSLPGDLHTLRPGDTWTGPGLRITATAAYNRDKEFHPREKEWLGFLLTLRGETIYYAGDTDVIPEMSKLGRVDVALLPVGGTYTMDPVEAAEAASIIQPGRCIPYHYGDIVGSEEDARRFSRLCTCRTDILTPAGV